MNKKLPNIFVNKIDKKLNNNEKVYYGEHDKNKEDVVDEFKDIKDIRDKMNEMYKDVPFLYKKKVSITLKDKTIEAKVISYNQNYLITMNNERILLDDILDIKFI